MLDSCRIWNCKIGVSDCFCRNPSFCNMNHVCSSLCDLHYVKIDRIVLTDFANFHSVSHTRSKTEKTSEAKKKANPYKTTNQNPQSIPKTHQQPLTTRKNRLAARRTPPPSCPTGLQGFPGAPHAAAADCACAVAAAAAAQQQPGEWQRLSGECIEGLVCLESCQGWC